MKNADNIYLIGLMGAGKTTVGKLLARHTGRDFYDSDVEIKKRTGVSIPHIFEVEGEEGFRARETAVLRDLTELSGIVLATGGGAVLAAENRDMLRGNGVVIYLRANVNDLWSRTRHDKSRPLLQTANPLAKLQELYAFRDPLYVETADLIIDTSRQNVNSLVQNILQLLEEQ